MSDSIVTKLMRVLAILFGVDGENKSTQEVIILNELEREWRLDKLQREIINDMSTLGR